MRASLRPSHESGQRCFESRLAKAAEYVYRTIRQQGHQRDVLDRMQTRAGLCEVIGYHAFEQKLDALFVGGAEGKAGSSA